MTEQINTPTIDRATAIAKLWHMGILIWKLDNLQKELYDTFTKAIQKTTVWSCSRRIGKSYALCCIAVEQCLQKPNTIVKFIAPTQKHVKMIIRPLLKEIFRDCPKDLKPDFRTADNIYRFDNGSEIQLAGTDSGHAENLRGGSSNLCIVDEAGFCDDLRYIIQSILIPTTTTTHGKIILSSTPPKNVNHEFVKYMEDAEIKGNFVKKTIYDGLGSRITQKMIDEIIEELGGIDSPDFRREYLCELIRDEELTVIPEFDDILQKKIVTEWQRPAYFDIYVSGDLGKKDYSVFLFGYYDFRHGKLVIEDEIALRGRNLDTEILAHAIKQKEKEHFTNPVTNEIQAPYLRVCDNNLIVIGDMYKLHNLNFMPTAKDDAAMALNNVRILIKQERIIIHPRCKTLISHLKYATWDKNKNTFARSVEFGHYDAVDALKYFCRAVQQTKNPYPASFGQGSGDNWWEGYKKPTPSQAFPEANNIKNIFKIRRSLR
jgi:hypothetical protein